MSFLGDLLFAPFEAVGEIFGTLNGSKQANTLNAALTREQMAWQTEEAQKNREFQDAQRLAQNAWSEQQYLKYNSPSAQVDQLRAAGVNPAALYGGSMSAPAQADISAGSPGSGSMPSSPGVPQMQGYNVLGGLQFISGFMKDMAQASKLGAETTRIQKLMSHEVENYILENKGKEFANAMAKDNAYILRNVKDVKVKQAFQDLQNAAVKALNTQADTDLKEMQSINQQYLSLLTAEQTNLTREQKIYLSQQNDTFMRNFESELSLRRSEQQKNSQQAELARLQGEQVDSYTKILNNPWYRSNLVDQLTESVRGLRKANKISDKSLELLEQNIIKLQKANSTYEIQLYTHLINETLGTVGDLVGEFTRFGLAKKFLSNESKIEKLQGEFDTYKKKVEFDSYQFQP